MADFEYVLVGGGLQNGLLALALRAHRPDARVLMIERASKLGGNHTWCFHASDVPGEAGRWLDPLVSARWPGYRVLFPGLQRTVDGDYSCVTSERFHEVVSSALDGVDGCALMLDCAVEEVGPHVVRLASGREVRGAVVVDSRGPRPDEADGRAGYQKFLGMQLELTSPHGLELPILMDATVDQTDGYRFLYVLPMGPRTVLLEDTYFHDTPDLDLDALRAGIRDYAARRGWDEACLLREEVGVLPMPWRGEARPPVDGGPLRAGYAGGWYHPGTGYSFPVALRLAELVASRPPESLFGPGLRDLVREHGRQASFARWLNHMLFRWYPPRARRSIFERFYRLPRETIENFYALRLRWRDRARLVLGRPPRGLSLRRGLGLSGGR